MNRDYISNYIDNINKALDINIEYDLCRAPMHRYALYGNCIGNRVFYWDDLFDRLSEMHKKQHIIHAYALLLDAEISRRGAINQDKEYINLLVDPNNVARIICLLMEVPFVEFEKLQIEVYALKRELFPYPNVDGTFYKVGDEIRNGITRFRVTSIFETDGSIMITAASLNGINGINRIFTKKETDMMTYYRITKPVEFEDI